MKKRTSTLEEARVARLLAVRRKDVAERALGALGIGIAGIVGIVLACAVCGRVVPLGKGDLAAGNPSQAILRSWDEAEVVFLARLPGGPTVEARDTAVGIGVPSGAEFRVDGAPAGLVFGPVGSRIDLAAAHAAREAEGVIVIQLPHGYRPASENVQVGQWTVRFRS